MWARRSRYLIAAIALAAIAAWPLLGRHDASASNAYVAPVVRDYLYRDATIRFYEERVRRDAHDQISARTLAAQYMQRYREALDVGDVERAIAQARRALRLQPQNNAPAYSILASAQYALHDFSGALRYERLTHVENPYDANASAQIALLDMEIGRYDDASRDLRLAARMQNGPALWAAQARYDELTGHLQSARRLMQRAARNSDAVYDTPAQARAWYHYRLGEMAFNEGDIETAKSEEHVAIADFPNFELAYRALARICSAVEDRHCAIDAATKAAVILPEPETLGYLADAQRALGDASAAAQTQALIFAIERIGNAYRINDRLLAVYYADHHLRPNDALRIARREAMRRGAEIFAQDTLAWAAAAAGQWNEAYHAMRLATRMHTQDARILFHAHVIERHFGHRDAAQRFLRDASSLDAVLVSRLEHLY